MPEKLQIYRFGPIDRADIDLRDLTIFVGPQAAGKSLAAQILCFLRRFGTLLNPADKAADSAASALEWWFGKEYPVYIAADTEVCWNPDEPNPETARRIRWNEGRLHLSQALVDSARNSPAGLPEKTEVYIPAGRTLYSFLPPYSLVSRVLASDEWPGYLLTFYEILGKAVHRLHRKQETERNHPASGNPFLEKRISDIFKGKVRYGPETVSLDIGKGTLHPQNIAAGQMEVWPFWAIVEAGIRSKQFEASSVCFEEPEAHLHPLAQHTVLEIVAYLVNRHTKFLITTHSPYILYAANNFLMAQKVLDAQKRLPSSISEETALSQNQVAAYRFCADGTVHDIMDREAGLIDEEELDNVADMLGQTFSELQDCLEEENESA